MSFGSPDNPYGQPQNPPQGQPGYGYPQAPQGVPQQGYGYPQQPGYPQAPGGPAAPRFASMGRRLGARLIDFVILFVIYGVFAAAGVAGSINSMKKCDVNDSQAVYDACVNHASSGLVSKFGAVFGVLALAGLLYEWLMVGLVGATVGKLAVGVRVVKADTGLKPGLGSSFIRWIIPMVGSFVCGIGQLVVYLSPFWDKSGRLQGWHDKAASTLVIQKN
jgi:uncharacterized RDD family membrane protein YckC